MKKHIFILLVLYILASVFAQAQIPPPLDFRMFDKRYVVKFYGYTVNIKNNQNISYDILFHITLFKNNEYILSVGSNKYESIVPDIVISYGKYNYVDKKLILSDYYNGYKFEFEVYDNAIVAKHCFKGLNQAKFKLLSSSFYLEDFYSHFLYFKTNKEEKEDNKGFQYTFHYGTYCREDDFKLKFTNTNLILYSALSAGLKVTNINAYSIFDFVLFEWLDPTNANRYTYSILDFVLSEGKFSYAGQTNEVILYDDILETPIYLPVRENAIIDRLTHYPKHLIWTDD